IDYGTSPVTLGSHLSVGTLTGSHTLNLASLTPSATYYYRVSSADGASNSSTFPAPPAAPSSFTTPAAPPTTCAHDQVAADFAAGTLSNAVVTTIGDGEVSLAASINVDFSNNALPPGWASYDWPSDGTVSAPTFSGGVMRLDGIRVNPEPFAAGP